MREILYQHLAVICDSANMDKFERLDHFYFFIIFFLSLEPSIPATSFDGRVHLIPNIVSVFNFVAPLREGFKKIDDKLWFEGVLQGSNMLLVII